MKRLGWLMLVCAVAMSVTGCEAIGDIFGAGVSVGIFLAILVVAIIFFVIVRAGRRK